jgi:hypothetical protein
MNLTSVQSELTKLNMVDMIKKMNSYATMRLRDIDIKQLEGRTPDDFTQDLLLKVLDGIRCWETSSTNNIKTFLMINLSSEISNFLKKIIRRDVTITNIKIEEDNYDINNDN